MNNLDKNFLIEHGFEEDTEKKVLRELFAANDTFKQTDITVAFTEPSMLLSRSKEKKVLVQTNSIQDDRLILKKGNTVIMNILLDEIHNCLVKQYDNGMYEFEFEVRDFRYSLHVLV